MKSEPGPPAVFGAAARASAQRVAFWLPRSRWLIMPPGRQGLADQLQPELRAARFQAQNAGRKREAIAVDDDVVELLERGGRVRLDRGSTTAVALRSGFHFSRRLLELGLCLTPLVTL
jgi:hypothetical protein